jgi:hypothetical protein
MALWLSLERDAMTPGRDASNWGSPECPGSSLVTLYFLRAAARTASSLALFGRPLTVLLAIMFFERKGLAEIGWGKPSCTSALAAPRESSSMSDWFLNYIRKRIKSLIKQTIK